MTDMFASEGKTRAQTAAYDAVRGLASESTSLIEYRSKGQVLVIGDSNALLEWEEFPDGMHSESLNTDNLSADEEVTIQGALGQFEISAGKNSLKADIVLDLSVQPILSMALLPPGYIAANKNSDHNAIHSELAGFVGTFSKPKYFNYDDSICAHGHSGSKGCTRCIDACPAQAITSIGNLVEVDPYRCHGGGICATVCPSGAMTYAYPSAKDLLSHLRILITTYVNEGEGAPVVAFVNENEQFRVQHAMPAALLITVEEVASVGPEAWLSALAWGAQTVLLFDLDDMPEPALNALNLHIEMVQDILQALAYPTESVCVLGDINELISVSGLPQIKASTHAVLEQKRQAFFMALDHLVEQANQSPVIASLPVGSIFGEVSVSAESCTLCMACVTTCPGNALQAGGELPQLGFVESSCVQCGVCVNTCPEEAISISPRLLLDPELRNKKRVLHEESPFHCISCGAAFATTSGITAIISRLTGHSMFADERALMRLKMCGDCRVKDMMVDPNSGL